MAKILTIKVRGIKITRKLIKALEKNVRIDTADEMKIVILNIEGDTKRRAARKEGFHQRSINSEVEIEKKQVIGLVGANQKYSPRLEDPDKGLKHRSRKGFIGKPTLALLPALAKHHGRIVKGVSRGVKKAIKRTGR